MTKEEINQKLDKVWGDSFTWLDLRSGLVKLIEDIEGTAYAAGVRAMNMLDFDDEE